MPESHFEHLNTGNEFVSIPMISTSNASLNRIGFIMHGFRACVEIHGGPECPLLRPIVTLDGENLFGSNVRSELVSNWIPRFSVESPKVTATATIVAPLERRGFVAVLSLTNNTDSRVEMEAGWGGCWQSSWVTTNIPRMLSGAKYGCLSSFRECTPVLEFRGQTPLFALAFVSEELAPAEIWSDEGGQRVSQCNNVTASVPAEQPLRYQVVSPCILEPRQTVDIPLYVGVGLEEVSAVASAHELRLQGWNRILEYVKDWLDKHTIECEDPYFRRMINMNSFFNYFFAQGITLDTEEVVMTTSRNSLNDHCGAYLDRDAMRWSLPAILQISWSQARKALIYAFTEQLHNVGVRTRFINGIVLEPGFQLDHLCAPIRALTLYVEHTGDMSIIFDRRVQTGINTIQRILAAQRHPDVALFETLLMPSGDPSELPYVCFSNVLVWRVLRDIALLYDRIRDLDRVEEAFRLSNLVKAAIIEHFVVDGPNGKMFAEMVDLKGGYVIGDDPAGSLQLMTYFDFCQANDPVYVNTVNWIHSDTNPRSGSNHPFAAPPPPGVSNPALVSVVNDLLTGRVDEALSFLRRAKLDDGLACKTVDPDTGEVTGGRAFASCAGYLAFGLRLALNALCPPTAMVEQKRRPSETLYEPPPEVNHDTKKARM